MDHEKIDVLDGAQFSEQIVAAIQKLGPDEAASRMGRALIVLSHSSGNDLTFSCTQGDIAVTRKTIADASKH